jgi:hypothetical protein
LNAAYSVLRDASSRKDYDRRRTNGYKPEQPQAENPEADPVDPSVAPDHTAKSRANNPMTFTSIFVVAVIVTLAKFGGEWAGKETARTGALRETEAARIQQIVTQFAESDGRLVLPQRGSSANARSESEIPTQFLLDFLNQIAELNNAYDSELEAIRIGSLFDPRRIQKDKGLVESRAIVRQAKSIVDNFEGKIALLFRKVQRQIHALSISEAHKKELLAGLERGARKAEHIHTLEKAIVAQSEEIVELLANSNDWIVQSDQIVFTNEYDQTRFESHFAAIQRITHQQEQIRKDGVAKFNQIFEGEQATVEMR